MPHVCPRCQRANPDVAVFCHFDGAELRPAYGAGRLDYHQLAREFVFPSGRRCRTYDDLVQGCQYEWEDARDLLRQGAFAQFLASVGRTDLAFAAQDTVRKQPDPDLALHDFVETLPAAQVQGPRLDLRPRRLILGAVRPGESRQAQLTVSNQGKGLLQGRLTVTEGGDWLKVDGQGGGNGHYPLKTARDQQVTLRADARGLAAPRTYSATLRVVTNGGVVEVPVSLDVTANPFPHAPFQGAGSPRDLAERMRTQPKSAVSLLESGEVQRWFELNRWNYPVQGPPAKGVAVVQQFFEGMGLSKPPPLQLSEADVYLLCVPPDLVRGQVTLRTPAKKWVYAHVDSDVPWLRVLTPYVGGAQQAPVTFEADSTMMEAGRVNVGTVEVTANAGQKLTFQVHVDVQRPQEPFTRRLLRPFFTGIVLGLLIRLLLAAPADLYARLLSAADREPAPGSLAFWSQSPTAQDGFVRHFTMTTWWLGALAGAVLVGRREHRRTDLLCGVVAGAGGGVAGAATLACLLGTVEAAPRAALSQLAFLGDGEAWLWTPVWLALAVAWWTALGGVAGLVLPRFGRFGKELLAGAAGPLAWACRRFGLRRASAYFTG